MQTLAAALRERVVVLDGGLATELEARGYDLSGELWSARLLADDASAIRDVHRAYFAAGAEVATTASYQAAPAALRSRGLDPDAMIRRSVALAREARDEHGAGWVAGSVGPYGAALADGSEYRGDYGIGVPELRRFHRPRLEMLVAAGVDVLAVETVPCLDEVEALVAELDELQFPAWLSLTCAGDRTRAGEPLATAFEVAGHRPWLLAAGVNCCSPPDVPSAVAGATAVTGRPGVAYPNSGEGWDAGARHWSGRAAFAADDVAGWLDAGARLVGGCCRVGPADIAAVARQVERLAS